MDQEIRLSTRPVSEAWIDSYRSAFRQINEINSYFNCTFPQTPYRLFLPRSLAARIKKFGVDSPLGKQFLPHLGELDSAGLSDPIGDQSNSPVSGIVHRYENRILFFPTSLCPVNCRYCFRKNELVSSDELPFVRPTHIQAAVDYLREHPEVNEVILSGGDPLMVKTSELKKNFEALAELSQIKTLRIHTRVPTSFPERVDQDLIDLLVLFKERFKHLILVLHLNHAEELDDAEVLTAIRLLKGTGLRILTQSVLLKGINDTQQALLDLFSQIADLGLQAYYLHHPDQVKGALHYYLPLEVGRNLVASLRTKLSGWALPQYIYDIPGGHGKVSAFSNEMVDLQGIKHQVKEPLINLH